MPRAKAVSGDVKPKRTTTSRAPRRASTSTPAKRKAPTVIPVSKRHTSSKSLLITLGVFLVIMAGSAFLGMADNGQINVTGVIQERGQTLRDLGRDDEAAKLVIPKDEVTRQPNGGLRPSTSKTNPPPTPAPATLGAEDSNPNSTSTEDSAVDSDTTESEETEVTEEANIDPAVTDDSSADTTTEETETI